MPAVAILSPFERLIRRDRVLITLGLAATTVLAWTYLARTASSMNAIAAEAQMHAAMGMGGMRSWGASDWLALFVMWSVMMIGMMLPSAAPVILLVLGVYRRREDPRARLAAITFVGGYVLAWATFSAATAAGQVGLHQATLLDGDMRLGSAAISGAILLAAGIYQWLPIKSRCLTHCQSPFGFLSQHWREGTTGGLVMGVRHGVFCVGCCWPLMTLLFVVGVMNLIWVAAIAAFVMIEKLLRRGPALSRLAGVAMGVWGIYLLVYA